ncbi:MAG: DUF5110 domain-containing protein, partial [Dysgonamonadaceae bacterium]|nr:DUF5110 domain-containing protein [Dysgonamonadaceae bacterium]
LGQDRQYASGYADTSIELLVYEGRDGFFEYYADAGDGYEYEQGEYLSIPIRWNNKTRRLTLEDAGGIHPPTNIRFKIRLVGPNAAKDERSLHYRGERIEIGF